MHEKFTIIIPTLWKSKKTFDALMEYERSKYVGEIILIDNKPSNKIDLSSFSKIRYFPQEKNIFVNPAWNLGYSLSNHKIIIANDDLIVKNIDNVLKKINEHDFDILGIDLKEINNDKAIRINKIDKMPFNQGYGCFMYIKNYILIPEQMKIWYGDNMLFDFAKKRGALENCNVDAEISKTVKSDKKFKEIGIKDGMTYRGLKNHIIEEDIEINSFTLINTTMKENKSESDIKGNVVKFFKKTRNMNIKRSEVINKIINRFNFSKYLEIGVYHPKLNFDLINTNFKDGVDPEPRRPVSYEMTSDEFFEKHSTNKKYDIIFIDGLHTYEQTYKDVINSINLLNEGGVIVMHDCNPPTEYHTRSYDEYLKTGGEWNGTVYKSFIQLKSELNDWTCFVVDVDWGCGIITKRKLKPNNGFNMNNIDDLSWNYFTENRKNLLDLTDYDDFLEILFC